MLATILSALAAIGLSAGLILFARRKPGYRHRQHTISELGEWGTPDQRLVGYALFLPVGLAMLLVGGQLYAASPPAGALGLCIAVGYLGAAAFPCDPGSPVSGSARQGMHNLAGAIEYLGGGAALLTLARAGGAPFQWAGAAVIGSAVALTVLPSTAPRGLVQRVAEVCLFGGLVCATNGLEHALF